MIQKFFFLLFIAWAGTEAYAYFFFARKRAASSLIRRLYFLPSAFLIIFVLLTFLLPEWGAVNRYLDWAATITYLLIVIPKLLFLLCTLPGILLQLLSKRHCKLFYWLGVIAACVCAGGILYGATIGKTNLETKDIDFHSTDLPPAFDGYKIVQISDLHTGSWRDKKQFMEEIVRTVNQQQADLIVFTGDIVNQRAVELDGFQDILSRLKAEDGVYSILGNHDYGTYYSWESPQEEADNLAGLQQREADMGWKLLNNAHVYLKRGNDSIALIGVENWGKPPFDGKGDLQKAMEGIRGNGFKILLSHNPTHWDAEVIPQTDINLTLSGHTHAMQFAIGDLSPCAWFYDEWKGMYEKEGQYLYVNIGLGFVGIPFRLGANPEITVFTLKCRNGKQPQAIDESN